jgi:hypothetical protein
MLVYWEHNGGGLQEERFDMEVEYEDFVSLKPHMWGNEKEEWMEDPEVRKS